MSLQGQDPRQQSQHGAMASSSGLRPQQQSLDLQVQQQQPIHQLYSEFGGVGGGYPPQQQSRVPPSISLADQIMMQGAWQPQQQQQQQMQQMPQGTSRGQSYMSLPSDFLGGSDFLVRR